MKDYGWDHRKFLISEVKHARRNRIIGRMFAVVVVMYFGGHLLYALLHGGPTYPVVLDRPVY